MAKTNVKVPKEGAKLKKSKKEKLTGSISKTTEVQVKTATRRSPREKIEFNKRRVAKRQQLLAVKNQRGVVYFSHLPHGFYEDQLTRYCSQFGTVTGVKVPKSDHGNSRGYAFVEFKHPEVAEVVAETMNNYLMFNRLVKTKVIPPSEQKPSAFRNIKAALVRAQKKKADANAARERTLTPEQEETYKKRAEARVQRLKSKLEKQGIKYEFTVAS